MKRLIYIVVFILISIGLYCNINELSFNQKDVLRVWVSSEEYELLKNLNSLFESQYDVEVEMKIVTSEQVMATLPLYVPSSDYPDVITVSHTLISDLVRLNIISPISDVFGSLNVLPTVKSGFKFKGEYNYGKQEHE